MIVYVEDNINNQRLLKRMLKKFGHDVLIADNPYDGLEIILHENPDMVFLDVHLKTRDTGLDLAMWIRERELDVPIVVVTCFNMMADRKRAIQAGCDDYISKPYTLPDVSRVLDRHFGKRHAATA